MAWLCVGAGDVAYDIEPGTSLPEVQLDVPGVPDKADGAVDDVLQHGLEPPALNVDPLRGEGFALDDFLSEGAQQVERNHGAKQDDFVGTEFPGWQAFDIEIALEFAVELLACAVIVVEPDGGSGAARQVGPPHVDFDFGNEQFVSMDVAKPLDDFEHGGNRRARLVAAGVEVVDEAGVDVLAVAAFLLVAHSSGEREPLFAGLLAQVALHQKMVVAKQGEVFSRVVAAVETEKTLAFEAELFERCHTAADGFRRAGLAVLLAGAQLAIEHVAFGTYIG